jgi:hypothetical protein
MVTAGIMRGIFLVGAILFACGSRPGPAHFDSNNEPALDAGLDGGGVAAVPPLPDAGYAGDASVSSQSDGGAVEDAGKPPVDAGPPEDAGSTVDGGEGGAVDGALDITINPGSPCASWLPLASDSSVVLNPDGGTWDGVYTDGVGDVAVTWGGKNGDYGWLQFSRFLPADGGAPAGVGGETLPIPTPGGFLWAWSERGPCLICESYLQSWPSGNGVFLGDGYPWDGSCSYARRPIGGVYTACQGAYPADRDGGVLTLQERDDGLRVIAETQGIAPTIIAVDRLDRLVVASPSGQQWIDAAGTSMSGSFSVDATGSAPLIGGGLLTLDDHVIPSGSAQVQTAPQWLQGHARQTFVVLDSRAYAFPSPSCEAAIYDSLGNLCGTLTFRGCTATPWFGPDGSAVAKLPNGAWKIWPQLLQ